MKYELLKLIYRFSPITDLFLSLIIIPGALLMYIYRRLGSKYFPKTTKILKKIGVFPIRKHFHEPLFDEKELHRSLKIRRNLPGIDFRESEQIKNLKLLKYEDEFIEFVNDSNKDKKDSSFKIKNNSFVGGDADFLYQFIRAYKPPKVIEIGCGSSTKIIRQALRKNREINKSSTKHICVEPYRESFLDNFAEIKLIRERVEVESSKIDWSTELSEGDLLFIDSSHTIRPQGPVLYEFLELIPRLKKGVLVHIHDIFSPYDYNYNCIVRDNYFWNEMYLLEALLTDSPKYQIMFSLNLLNKKHYKELSRVCPFLNKNQEYIGSFYFKIN